MQSIIYNFEKPKFGLVPDQQQQEDNIELTTNDICTIWSIRLQGGTKLPVPISLTWFKWFETFSASKCVVREACGFSSSNVSCREYCRFSFIFLSYFMTSSIKRLKQKMRRFIEHWNEKHYLAHRKSSSGPI